MLKLVCVCIGLLFSLNLFAGSAAVADKVIKMSTTTSTQSSGLLDLLVPVFKMDTGIAVKVISKGTGAAIRDGQDGNVDLIFVHAKDREDKFVAEGYGTKRFAVMHNDFIIIGPGSDPVKIREMSDAGRALAKIATAKASFISRGDDSGTHTKEQFLWQKSGIKLVKQSRIIFKKGKKIKTISKVPADAASWYWSIGQGMGKTIIFAEEKQAYAISDRGTYIKYRYGRTPSLDLDILCEGGDDLANPYGIIPVSPVKHPHVQYDLAMEFVNWIISKKGQEMIDNYRLEGKQLFYPDAIK